MLQFFRNTVPSSQTKINKKKSPNKANTTATSNFIIFNTTSTSKPLLILNKSDRIVISEDADVVVDTVIVTLAHARLLIANG